MPVPVLSPRIRGEGLPAVRLEATGAGHLFSSRWTEDAEGQIRGAAPLLMCMLKSSCAAGLPRTASAHADFLEQQPEGQAGP